MDENLAEKGRRYYEEHLRTRLEPDENGRYLALEPESGQYFLGKTGGQALAQALAALPEHYFYLTRVGYGYAHRFGSYGKHRERLG